MNFQSGSECENECRSGLSDASVEAGLQLRENIPQICSPGETAQEAGQRDENCLKRFEEARAKLAKLRGSKRAQMSLGWLAQNPSEWIGRKIRNRATGKVYVVRTVFASGRVEMEKSWMTYSSYVPIIRAEFETYS